MSAGGAGRDTVAARIGGDAGWGVGWTAADRHGNREVQDMPRELLRAFSKRAEQVNAEVDRLASPYGLTAQASTFARGTSWSLSAPA
jgi:hypothetical protein